MHRGWNRGWWILLGWAWPSALAAEDVTNRVSLLQPTAEVIAATQRLRVAPGLQVDAWASEPLVENITSLDFDSQGRAYVVETGRRRTSVFDIRNLKDWIDDDFALRTVPDRIAFLTGQLGTNAAFRAAASPGRPGAFGDFNQDGVVDARDLEVESERIRVVWDSNGDGRADRSAVHADGFNTKVSGVAAGVLVSGSDVWFTCIPDLWRLPAAGVEPVPVAKGTPLLTGFGVHIAFGGHDLHGLTLGPDGRLYFSIADRGSHVTNREGRVIALPDTGAIFRSEPDGSRMELVASGLRNPQELAFDEWGNLWTGDNNGDGGDKARWTLVLPGSEHGWTIGWQWLPKMGAWNSERLWHTRESNTSLSILPPVAHVGHGPAGIAYYPGTGLGPAYENHFFYADFPGGIRTFKVERADGFWRVAGEGKWMEDNSPAQMQGKLLWDLSPVDVAFPPGGGVVVADWVQGWDKTGKGRLWKVTDPALCDDPLIRETASLLKQGMDGRKRNVLHGLLGHADLRVRQEAQFEIAQRGPDEWSALAVTARSGTNPRAQRHALRALAQLLRVDAGREDYFDELSAGLRWMDDPDATVVVEACRLFGEARFAPAQNKFLTLFQHPDPRVVSAAVFAYRDLFVGHSDPDQPLRFKVGTLAKVRGALPGFMDRLLPAPGSEPRPGDVMWPVADLRDTLIRAGGRDPVLQHAAAMLLLEICRLNPSAMFPGLATLSRNSHPPVRSTMLLVARRLAVPDVASFLEDSDPRLSLEAARSIHDVGITSAYSDLIRYLDTGMPKAADARFTADAPFPFTRQEWRTFFLRRSVNAAFRRGRPEDLPILSRAAANSDLPEIVRVEALDCLRDWPVPPRRDRVTGLHFPLEPRDPAPALGALSDAWRACAAESAPDSIVLAAIAAAERLQLPDLPIRLAALARHPSDAVRKKIQPDTAKLDPSDALPLGTDPAVWESVLRGGDAAKGRQLFAERADWGCLRCHKFGGEGGDVGPDLTGIGNRLSKAQLLEAILFPNRAIAPGYESILLTLTDGDSVVGSIRSETATEVVLLVPVEGEVRIPVSRIQARDRAPSAMPDGLGEMMTRGEARHLLEALSR